MATSSDKGGWHAAIFVIIVEFAQRFAYYGLAANLITYLTNTLGLPTAAAAKSVNTWTGIANLFPFIGALLADSYLGRFTTILISSLLYLFGMVGLLVSVTVAPAGVKEAAFFTALYVVAVGEGGHLPCVQTFAADQFEEDTAEEKAAKSSFFNWWFVAIVLAGTTASLVVVYIQDNIGWAEGISVLVAVLAVAIALFVGGTKRYKIRRPIGSPITSVAQVFAAAARKWRVDETRDGLGICHEDDGGVGKGLLRTQYLARTNQLRFLDKAMIKDKQDASTKTRNPWRLCSQHQVEEVKLVARLVPIWLTCVTFHVVQSQVHTYFIKQGSTMARTIGPHFQVPPASLQAFVGVIILVFVAVYDRILVPAAASVTGHPAGITTLQRIGAGLFLSVVNMAVAGAVEARRVGVAGRHGLADAPEATVPMSIWWLLPQYAITSVSDVFVVVGMQELFYEEVPEAMRSFGAAANLSTVAFGSFLSSLVISGVRVASGGRWLGDNLNRARLDRFYWVLAGLSGVSLGAFGLVAKMFVFKKVEDGSSSSFSSDRKERGRV